MNQLKVHEHFNAIPEGTSIDKIGKRTCCLIGLAIGALAPLPGNLVHTAEVRRYFMENSVVLREVAFDINEVVSFNVDRATEYAYRVYQRRYDIAFDCNPMELFAPVAFAAAVEEHMPEVKDCAIDLTSVAKTMECLREGVKEKTGADQV